MPPFSSWEGCSLPAARERMGPDRPERAASPQPEGTGAVAPPPAASRARAAPVVVPGPAAPRAARHRAGLPGPEARPRAAAREPVVEPPVRAVPAAAVVNPATEPAVQAARCPTGAGAPAEVEDHRLAISRTRTTASGRLPPASTRHGSSTSATYRGPRLLRSTIRRGPRWTCRTIGASPCPSPRTRQRVGAAGT